MNRQNRTTNSNKGFSPGGLTSTGHGNPHKLGHSASVQVQHCLTI